MKVSISWLKEYLNVPIDAHELSNSLTMAGLEVDSVQDRYAWMNTVITGKICQVAAHPQSNHLTVCEVDLGNQYVTIICGAANASPGLVSAVALPETSLPDGTLIQPTMIRGILSNGMLCSEYELGIGADSSGILALPADTPIGKNLAQVLHLQDYVLDIDLTPNRADCWSIIGIAREAGAILHTPVKSPKIEFQTSGEEIHQLASVSVENFHDCPRYTALCFRDVKVGPSPFWLQDRLRSVGVRPINNIVDATNLVMMEMGQPIHAFDYDMLAEHRIVVRNAEEGQTFVTLDNKQRLLTSDMLMICDGQKPVAIAGVMGGLNSEITEKTRHILIECAYFNPVSIRKTAKKLGLSTDASNRYERGVDPAITIPAIERIRAILAEISGGVMVKGLIDTHDDRCLPIKTQLTVTVSGINDLLGTKLTRDQMRSLLEPIEFKVDYGSYNDDEFTVKPPSFRVDINIPVDIAEEVARTMGYDNIPLTYPIMPIDAVPPDKMIQFRQRVKELMTGFGLTETLNYCFIHHASTAMLRLPDNDRRQQAVQVLNPLTEDQSVMRTTLIPGLLETVRRNLMYQNKDLKLFETGKVFFNQGTEQLPHEIEMLAGIWTGKRFSGSWHYKELACDFYDLKGIVEGFLSALHFNKIQFQRLPPEQCYYVRPGHAARIMIVTDNKQTLDIGVIGEIHPEVAENYYLKQTVFVFEVNIENIMSLLPGTCMAKPISKYPAIDRDITLIVDKNIHVANILACIEDIGEELVENSRVLDIFEGDKLADDKKSVSLRLTYRSFNNTLEDDTITSLNKSIAERIMSQFNAALP